MTFNRLEKPTLRKTRTFPLNYLAYVVHSFDKVSTASKGQNLQLTNYT